MKWVYCLPHFSERLISQPKCYFHRVIQYSVSKRSGDLPASGGSRPSGPEYRGPVTLSL